MKKNKIFRIISYILLPVLVAICILSIVYISCVNICGYSSEEEYFSGESFMRKYIYDLEDNMEKLIFAQDNSYDFVQDGNNRIFYDTSIGENYFGNSRILNQLNRIYFVIKYEDKIFTNVSKEDAKTYSELMEYMSREKENENCEYFNFEKGKYSATNTKNAEIAKNYSYFEDCSYEYFVTNGVVQSSDEVTKTTPELSGQTYAEPIVTEPATSETTILEQKPNINFEYKTAYGKDFEVYSCYEKKLKENTELNAIITFLDNTKDYQIEIYVVLPIAFILMLGVIIFLINSIGHNDDGNEIDIKAFDKIPLEIILAIFAIIVLFTLFVVFETVYSLTRINNIIAILTSLYVLNFASLEVIFTTVAKRIKAKMFWKTTLCGRIAKFFIKFLVKIKNKIVEINNKITINMSVLVKFILFLLIYVLINICIIGIFEDFGIIIDIILAGYVVYQVILRINSFIKLETALKDIYEGNNKVRLFKEDFSPEFRRCIEYVNDISNGFENAVEESLKSERLKTELITNVSHDIKTPLTSIINYVDLLKKENIEDEKVKEYIGILDNKSQRLKKLIEDLVEASKASSGNVKMNLENINIIELIKQAIGEFEDKFKDKGLEIITEFPKNSVEIRADSRYMYRVIENLFSNVSKYALENSRFYIDSKVKGQKIKIELKNISKERLNITEEELMQRFVRGDKSRTTEGNGLGLAIAKSLTELQGGTLNCKIDGDLFKAEIEFDII